MSASGQALLVLGSGPGIGSSTAKTFASKGLFSKDCVHLQNVPHGFTYNTYGNRNRHLPYR